MVYGGKTGGWALDATTISRLADATLQGTAKFAVNINDAYFWCSGHEPVTISAQPFVPKGMKVPELTIGTKAARSSLIVEDTSSALEELNYTSRFSTLPAEWYMGIVVAGEWQEIYRLSWSIMQCHWRTGQFRFALHSSVGTYPRAGLPMFGRRCCLTYKGTYCARGDQGGAGATGYATAKTCDGAEATCILRHGAGVLGGPYLPFLGMPYAPEPGESIELNAGISGTRSTYTFGQGYTRDEDEPGGVFDRRSAAPSANPLWAKNQPIGDFDAGVTSAVGDFVDEAVNS